MVQPGKRFRLDDFYGILINSTHIPLTIISNKRGDILHILHMYSFTFIKEKELKDRLYIVIYIYLIKSLSLKRTGGIISVVLHTTQEQQ